MWLMAAVAVTGLAGAIDAVEPGDAEGAGFDADVDLVALLEAVVVVGIDSEAFIPAAGPPGIDE